MNYFSDDFKNSISGFDGGVEFLKRSKLIAIKLMFVLVIARISPVNVLII